MKEDWDHSLLRRRRPLDALSQVMIVDNSNHFSIIPLCSIHFNLAKKYNFYRFFPRTRKNVHLCKMYRGKDANTCLFDPLIVWKSKID